MTFDLESAVKKANEAYFAQQGVAVPASIRVKRCIEPGCADEEFGKGFCYHHWRRYEHAGRAHD